MTTLLVLSLLALLIYGVERNHRRHATTGLAGSRNFVDRDAERVHADTAALAARNPARHARTWRHGQLRARAL